MNRKGFELSINFIVIIILSMVVFSMGLIFFKNLMGEAQEITANLNKDTERQIENLLDRGEMVAFPITSRDVKAGDVGIYGLGVLNVIGTPATFTVEIQCTTGIDSKDVEHSDWCDPGTAKWATQIDPFNLENNAKRVIPIGIQAIKSKPSGTYIFTVTVKTGGEVYGSVQQIYLNII